MSTKGVENHRDSEHMHEKQTYAQIKRANKQRQSQNPGLKPKN